MQIHLPGAIDLNEEVLEEVFRHTPVGVVLSDLHGSVLDANLAFCRMIGRSREEIVERPYRTFVHPEEQESTQTSLSRLRAEEVPSIENVRRWVAADGRTVTTRVSASIVRSKDGEPIAGIAFIEDIGERLAMENALRESEARYRRVVEDQTEFIVRCTRDGVRTFVNEAYCRYFDSTPEQLLGTSFFSSVPESEREQIEHKYASLTPDHPVLTEEHQVVVPDGSLRWHRWTDRGFFDADGMLVDIQAVGSDITEEREAHERRRRSEENYRRLYSALPVAVWETDFTAVLAELARRGLETPDQLREAIENNPPLFLELAAFAHSITANDAAVTMTGASSSDIIPWLSERYTDEAAVAYARAAAPLILGDVRTVDVEIPLRTADGQSIDLLQRLTRNPEWPSEPRAIAIAINVTDRKRAERELVHRKQILEEAEVLAGIGSWDWYPTTDQIYGSAGFWRIFTGKAEARFGSAAEVLLSFHRDDRRRAMEIARSVRDTGHEPESANPDMVIVHRDGTTVIARGATSAERNDEGQTVRVYGVIQDVTEQRRTEQAVQREREAMTRADKLISLGVLVSGVAHEVNNPNHSIMLNAPLLRDAWKDVVPLVDRHAETDRDLRVGNMPWGEIRTEGAAMIDDIERASTRIRDIVTELRGFTLDRPAGEWRVVSMNDVVRSSMRLLANHLRKATSRFSMVLAEDLPTFRGHPGRLEQVLVNLVINACQSLESTECAVTIETGRTPTHVFVRVTDEGRGIAAEDLRKIKDPFFTTKRASGGSGLGLPVSDRIAQEHGGELTFSSEPGVGTTATLSIPIAERAWPRS